MGTSTTKRRSANTIGETGLETLEVAEARGANVTVSSQEQRDHAITVMIVFLLDERKMPMTLM
jgi:hypothetical protein